LGVAQKLANNGTIVVLMFEELMSKNSFERHLYWKNFIEIARYCRMKKVPFIVASGTKDPLHIRPRQARLALAQVLGFDRDRAEKYLSIKVE
jgi:RNase P/RNase MRP subunit p30